jgi:hypothetical protein
MQDRRNLAQDSRRVSGSQGAIVMKGKVHLSNDFDVWRQSMIEIGYSKESLELIDRMFCQLVEYPFPIMMVVVTGLFLRVMQAGEIARQEQFERVVDRLAGNLKRGVHVLTQ